MNPDLDVTTWEQTSGVGLTLTRDEALILRSAAYLHTATCAVEREQARRAGDLLEVTRWSVRHDRIKALADRLERLVAAQTSPGSPAVTNTPAAGDTGSPVYGGVELPSMACDECGMPDGETFAGGRVVLCGSCREKLHSAIAADLGLAPRVEDDDEYLVAPCETCELTVTSRFWHESKRVCWGCWNRARVSA